MSVNQLDIEQLENTIEHAKEKLEMRERMIRLAQNKDFQVVFEQGYGRDEAARLTSLLGDPNKAIDQDGVMADLSAIAAFGRYMRKIMTDGDIAIKEIQDSTEVLDQIRQESVE